MPVTITISSPLPDADCKIICGQLEFAGVANDPAWFSKVQDLLLNLRQHQPHYPLYLIKLSFSELVTIPVVRYTKEKQRLERLLNPA